MSAAERAAFLVVLVLDATRRTALLIGVSCPQAISAVGRCGVDIAAAAGGPRWRDEGYLCRGDGGRGRGVGIVVAAVAIAFLLAGCGRRRGSRRRRGWKASNHMTSYAPDFYRTTHVRKNGMTMMHQPQLSRQTRKK